MTQPGIVMWVQSLFDQHREASRREALEYSQISTHAPQRIEFGVVLHILNDLESVNVLIIHLKAWPEVGARLVLAALPTPVRQHHRKAGGRAVVELLILMANTD